MNLVFMPFKLHSVPVSRLLITDSEGNQVDKIGGPFNEDSLTNISCIAEGGKPFK